MSHKVSHDDVAATRRDWQRPILSRLNHVCLLRAADIRLPDRHDNPTRPACPSPWALHGLLLWGCIPEPCRPVEGQALLSDQFISPQRCPDKLWEQILNRMLCGLLPQELSFHSGHS